MAASIKVTVSSHHFKVEPFSDAAKAVCYEFAKRFLKIDIQNKQRTITTFAAANASRSWFRFHINTLQEFYAYARNRNYPLDKIDVVTRALKVPSKVHLPVKAGWTPRDYQEPIIEYLVKEQAETKPKSRLVGIATGEGKEQPLDARIKIPGGWSTMGEMKVGTEVIAHDGTVTKVDGVFPQGEKEIFKITFADGRSTECGADHLWRVFIANEGNIGKRWRVVNTLEVIRLLNVSQPRVYIQLCEPEATPEVDLPLDPYMLGLLIGNGGFSSETIKYTTQDHATIDYIASVLPQGVRIRKSPTQYENKFECSFVRDMLFPTTPSFRQWFIELGLWGHLSYTKFIPKIYLGASIDQRKELLRGLMDSDGTIGTSGFSSYSTSSEQLSKDVQYLVRSLGGIASISSRIPTFEYKGLKKLGARNYNVGIRVKKPSELFKIARKHVRTNDNNQYSFGLKLRVKSVELIGKKEAQCISIEHPDHLYVTDDFVVTHNTSVALFALNKIGNRVFCVVKPKYIEKWVGDFCNVLDIKPKDILVIQGGNALQSLTQMALTKGDIDPYKAIIVSNRTMDNYLKAYELLGNNLDTMGYMVNPDELLEKLDVGVLLRDEAHEEFHSVFRLDLYIHVPLTISLTATLINLDQTMMRMYEVMFPTEHRYAARPARKYTDSYGVTYRVNPNYRLKTTERGQSTYSHNAYESSILKNETFTHNYANMLKYYLDRGFVQNYVPGNKAIVFASSVAMCTKLTEKLSEFYPQYNVKRYVAEDDYQLNYQKPDIRVTTIGSGGTGHDIKGLTDGHMTNAIDSIQANIQAFGRLRDLKEKQTRFFFYSCEQIPKHMKYAHKKGELMGQRAKSYSRITYREL